MLIGCQKRDIRSCSHGKATELITHKVIALDDGELYMTRAMLKDECGWVMGAGNYWNSASGMAYWEIFILIPVIHRLVIFE